LVPLTILKLYSAKWGKHALSEGHEGKKKDWERE